MIFDTESGLEAYSYSFYNELPDYNTAFKLDATAADYAAKNQLDTYESGSYTTNTATTWDWTALRNINYFIKYNTGGGVSEKVRNNYNGIARFFRAYFYFDKLVTYGEVPWIDELIESDDTEKLYSKRDTRDVIISNIIEDLNYAFENISESGTTGNSNVINKWCAAFLKSRVCLFEASWRKYHKGTDLVEGCEIPSEELFSQAAEAAHHGGVLSGGAPMGGPSAPVRCGGAVRASGDGYPGAGVSLLGKRVLKGGGSIAGDRRL